MPNAPPHVARLAALAAVDADPTLREAYALKGGLVLRHVYGSPRPSSDLDFNLVADYPNDVTPAARETMRDFTARLRRGLGTTAPAFGLSRAGVRIRWWSRALPTAFAEVWYEAGGDAGTVELQVTLSETICHTARARIDGVPVRVATLEDVVADKLKVLLQQVPRHQVRASDAFDLWFALAEAPFVPEPAAVADCLRRKAAAWPSLHPLTAACYRAEAVRTFAEAGYRKLRAETPDLPVPPFDEVWAQILAFVDALDLGEASDG